MSFHLFRRPGSAFVLDDDEAYLRMLGLVLPQGRLFLKTHPLMNRHSRYTNSAFILDPTALVWRYIRDTKSKENIQGNDEDSQKGMWLTEAGLELRYFGMTCKYLGNFTAA